MLYYAALQEQEAVRTPIRGVCMPARRACEIVVLSESASDERLLPFALSYAECARYLHTPVPSATLNSMTTRDFKVFLEPDEDYGGYVVVCPSIPGCYSQGKTVPEALANIREAMDLCIEDMESRGEEIPDPNNVLIGSVVSR